MPRKALTTPTKLKQKSLFDFVGSSSPAAQQAIASSARFGKRKRTQSRSPRKLPKSRRAKDVTSDDENLTSDEEKGNTSSDVGAISFEAPIIEVIDEEDEEISPRRPATQRKTRRRRAGSEASAAVSSESQEDKVGMPVQWKGKAIGGKRKKMVIESDSEEERPRKRKLVKGIRPPTPEEEDLLKEVDEDKIVENRLRTRKKQSAFQKNLEKLKRKKRGESIVSQSSGSESDSAGDAEPFEHARPDGEQLSDSESAAGGTVDEDSFIVEDGNDVVAELPPEFSMTTYQDLSHHFKVICQAFVHLALQPPGDREGFVKEELRKPYFSVPLTVARRKISGMRDSLVASSTWRPEFIKALETYPEFELTRMDFAVPHCDACHLGKRMSTFNGRLSGSPYDKGTFEPLRDSSDQSDASDEENKQLKREFDLGRFCAKRTRVFHTFTHWEYALFKSLSQEVDSLWENNRKRRADIRTFYTSTSRPKYDPYDPKDADKIMERLDRTKTIDDEWRKIKHMMDEARNLDMAAKKGDGDIDDLAG